MRKELTIFFFVGSTTVLVDYLSYSLLLNVLSTQVGIAKGIGFLTGTAFAYFANKTWTFGHKRQANGSVWRFATLYTCTLGTNVLINDACLHWLGLTSSAKQIAFILATGLSATLNFIGMKFFVFKAAPTHQELA